MFDEIDAYVDIGDPSHDYDELDDLDGVYGGLDDEEDYASTMRPSMLYTSCLSASFWRILCCILTPYRLDPTVKRMFFRV